MPSPYIAHSEIGFMHAGAEELDRKLREGDGLGWTGDPRLYLAVGIMVDKRDPKNPRTGRRYEVRRENEDGTDSFIGGWRMEDFDRILFDLAPMRMDAPNRVDTIDLIDKANAEKDAEISRQIRDNLGEVMEYGAHLVHDRTEPRNVFRQVGGSADVQPDVAESP